MKVKYLVQVSDSESESESEIPGTGVDLEVARPFPGHVIARLVRVPTTRRAQFPLHVLMVGVAGV